MAGSCLSHLPWISDARGPAGGDGHGIARAGRVSVDRPLHVIKRLVDLCVVFVVCNVVVFVCGVCKRGHAVACSLNKTTNPRSQNNADHHQTTHLHQAAAIRQHAVPRGVAQRRAGVLQRTAHLGMLIGVDGRSNVIIFIYFWWASELTVHRCSPARGAPGG